MDSDANKVPDGDNKPGMHWVTSLALAVLAVMVIAVIWLMATGAKHGPYVPHPITPADEAIADDAMPITTTVEETLNPCGDTTDDSNPCEESVESENPCTDTQDNPSSE